MKRSALLLVPLALGVLGLVAVPRIDWLDDMSGLVYFDPELLAWRREDQGRPLPTLTTILTSGLDLDFDHRGFRRHAAH